VKPGDAIELRVSDGRIDVTVDRVEKSSATPSNEEKP
jgi:ribosomal 50S subunit-recycling heat shock protein